MTTLELLTEALVALQAEKPEDRSEKARRCQIAITDLEKVIAYYKTYVSED